MPSGLDIILAVGGAVALALIGLWLFRRYVELRVLQVHDRVTGSMHAIVGVLFAVLLAFMVLAAWERYVEARDVAKHEANALADLYLAAAAYPEPVRGLLRKHIRDYASVVVTEEWSESARGVGSRDAWAAYNQIWLQYLAFEPGTEPERLWHRWSINELAGLSDYRRIRLLKGRSAIPQLIWVVLFVVGAVQIVFSYFYGFRSFGLHALMTGALAGTMALVFVLLYALERPFTEPAQLRPDAFVEVLRTFETPPPSLSGR